MFCLLFSMKILQSILYLNNIVKIFGIEESDDKDLFEEIWQKTFFTNLKNLEEINYEQSDGQKMGKSIVKSEQNENEEKIKEFSTKSLKKTKDEPFKQSEKEEKQEATIKIETFFNEQKEEQIDTNWPISKGKKAARSESDFENEENQVKLMIVNQFIKKREEFQMESDYKKENRNKKECEIAKELGTYRDKIYQWKREIEEKGQQKKEKKCEKDEEKMKKIIEKFDEKRKKYEKKTKSEKRNYLKIDDEIAKGLGVTRGKIYRWKSEIGMKKQKNKTKIKDEGQKIEITQRFEEIRKHRFENNWQKEKRSKIEHKIAKELGTYRNKIYEWKKELMPTKGFSTEQKSEIIKKFEKIKEEFSNNFNRKATRTIEKLIARKLGVSNSTIFRWKTQLGDLH